ncbi:MAG: hypothetical protein F4W92_10870 [Gammaproteobacteria bacterium]|nr:hypothetical protein [Gammaproteobacteria bacterium]
MDQEITVIDADGHIMEPSNLWKEWIDPKFRDNCIHVIRDKKDGDKFIVDGVPSVKIRRLGGIAPPLNKNTVNWNFLELASYIPYMESLLEASYIPEKRLTWMDEQSICESWLFPSLGLIWPQETKADDEYVYKHMVAYNRWIHNFCLVNSDRLIPVGQTYIFPDHDNVAQLELLSEMDFRHIMLPVCRTGSCFANGYKRFWSAVNEHQFIVHMHKAAIPNFLNIEIGTRVGAYGTGLFFSHVNDILPGIMCLVGLLDSLIPEKYPKIRFTVLECNAGWVPSWLERMDESYEILKTNGRCNMIRKPSEVILQSDRFLFGIGFEENLSPLSEITDKLVIATDFPHPDCPIDSIAQWRFLLDELPEGDRSAILGSNARRFSTQHFNEK